MRNATLLFLAGLCGCHAAEASALPQASPPLPVSTAAVEADTVDLGLLHVATVVAERDALLTHPTGGRVVEVRAVLGARVKQGDELVRLREEEARWTEAGARAALAEAERATGEPELAAAQEAARLAADALLRAERLLAAGSFSEQELVRLRGQEASARAQVRQALAAREAARARVQQALVSVRQSRESRSTLVLRAPFDGVVASVDVKEGGTLSAGAPAVRVVAPGALRLAFEVPPHEVSVIALGAPVRPASDEGPRFTAHVVRRAGVLGGLTRTEQVEALVDESSGLLAGARVAVRVARNEPLAVARLPRDAVRSFAGVRRAFVVREGRVEERLLDVVQVRADAILARAGVSPGERVVLLPPPSLRDGMAVQP